MTEIMEEKMIHSLLERLKEVNFILATCSNDQMPFEQAYVIARFYYDYQDTNVIYLYIKVILACQIFKGEKSSVMSSFLMLPLTNRSLEMKKYILLHINVK